MKEIYSSSREELLKEIEKLPEFELVKIYTNKNGEYGEQEEFKAVLERGKDQALAVVSSEYSLVQMRDVFVQALSYIEQVAQGRVLYRNGYGQLEVFPEGSRIGVYVLNSVDRSSAIKIGFLTQENGATIYIPPEEVREYKRLHRGVPLHEMQNAGEVLLKAQEAWALIVSKLSNVPLDEELVVEVKKAVDAGEKLSEEIDRFVNDSLDKYAGRPQTLWDLFLYVLKAVSTGNYKAELNRQKRLRRLSCTLLALCLGR